jgi:hypothetical protein
LFLAPAYLLARNQAPDDRQGAADADGRLIGVLVDFLIYREVSLSWPVRFAWQKNVVSELDVSKASPRDRYLRNELPEHTRITDTVHISEAAMRKFRQSQEVKSAGAPRKEQPDNILDKDLAESIGVLGIESTDFSREEVKKAFINSIKKYHPDMQSASDAKTREIATEKARKIIEAYRNIEKKI